MCVWFMKYYLVLYLGPLSATVPFGICTNSYDTYGDGLDVSHRPPATEHRYNSKRVIEIGVLHHHPSNGRVQLET